MIIDATNLKDDIEEMFLEISGEEIAQADPEDLDFESILDNVFCKFDYEWMEDYIRDNVDTFEISETDEIIEKLAIHLVEEELPILRNDILEETESLIEELIEQQQENRINSLFAI